jgi:hypothetical protein
MEEPVRTLVEKDRIVDTITELFLATDRRDWDAVKACLAPRVAFDMSSLTGAAVSTLTGEEIAKAWEVGLKPIRQVHHQAGNFRVSVREDTADAFCYGTASHYLPNPSGRNTRVFVGSYDFGLRREGGRWRIERFRFNLKYLDGNLELEKAAAP